MENLVVYLLVAFLGGGGVVVVLVMWFIHNFEKYEYFVGFCARIFSSFNKRWEYTRAATEVQARVNSAAKHLNGMGQVLPHGLKIEFVKDAGQAETIMRRGEVIVKLGYSKDRDRDLVRSTLAYVGKDLLPKVRVYVIGDLMKATDLMVAKDILNLCRDEAAMSMFLRECYTPEVEGNAEVKAHWDVLDSVSKVGHFYRIFLAQLRMLGEQLFPGVPTVAAQREVTEFAAFLRDIANKAAGEDVNLDFVKARFRVKVLLVAKQETKVWGAAGYDARIRQALKDGIEYVYVCAWGAENCSLAKEVAAEQAGAKRLTILASDTFERSFEQDRKTQAVCIQCATNLRGGSQDSLGAPGVLRGLLERHIDQVRDGKIEIVSEARDAGVLSKVVVKGESDNIDAVGIIRSNLQGAALRLALGNERVDVIKWDADPMRLIASSLLPGEEAVVTGVSVSPTEQVALVEVPRNRMSKAIGRQGVNVRLANRVTGWHIEVKKML